MRSDDDPDTQQTRIAWDVPSRKSGALILPERYEDLGFLGRGGMGEVRRVRDCQLKRTMAMKIIRLELLEHPDAATRFIEEAQATAQLQHPGIVPVHDLGQLSDGRFYFTMKEVQGRTFKEAIREVHALSEADAWPSPNLAANPSPTASPEPVRESPWTLRRLIDAFHKVCEAMAYAHERGVVHRDLKPANLMLGPFGEVMVMDWGLAKVRSRLAPTTRADDPAPAPIETARSSDPQLMTQAGQVAGTPAYMPPEQARADSAMLGPASDVYSLGAILYEILSGRPPYTGSSAEDVLAQVLLGGPLPVGRRLGVTMPGGREGDTLFPGLDFVGAFGRDEVVDQDIDPFIPEELRQICERAMAREPSARYPDARTMAAAIGQWLEGASRRERAQRVVEDAARLPGEIRRLRGQADDLRVRSRAILAGIRGFEPVERRQAGWTLEDQAAQLELETDQMELQYLQALRGALMLDPGLEEGHERLAEYYRERHQEAEAEGNARVAAQYEVMLRSSDRHGRYATYLKGDGAVTLWTDPRGAEVDLYRFELQEHRLVRKYERRLGRTPLNGVVLPKGSYVLQVRAPGCAEVWYPVFIGRGEHWDGVRPGENRPHPIYLPHKGELGPDDRYVPAGWYWSGGDPEAYNHLARRRLWVDARVWRRFPVTNTEYLEFLNDLVAQGREADALYWAPRERSALAEAGPVIYGRDEQGRFVLRADADGDIWEPDWPVIMIDLAGAMAFAAWAARDGVPWRLPGELEWEKAARGVDGRLFPWGPYWDPSWACMCESAEKPRPVVIDSYPDDISIYGLRGLAGNVRDWCTDIYQKEGPPTTGNLVIPPPMLAAESGENRVNRGGDWYGAASGLRCSSRFRMGPSSRYGHIGMRLVREIGG